MTYEYPTDEKIEQELITYVMESQAFNDYCDENEVELEDGTYDSPCFLDFLEAYGEQDALRAFYEQTKL
jgi:hypothetical protein